MSQNDDKAKAIAKEIINGYQSSLRNIPKGIPIQKARQYAADARTSAADELTKLARGRGISAGMRARIEAVAKKAKGHSSGHGSWWANDSGSNDNPSSWI